MEKFNFDKVNEARKTGAEIWLTDEAANLLLSNAKVRTSKGRLSITANGHTLVVQQKSQLFGQSTCYMQVCMLDKKRVSEENKKVAPVII